MNTCSSHQESTVLVLIIKRMTLLIQKHVDIVHSAAVLLEKCQLIKYEQLMGHFQSLELGQIASHYYVIYNLMMDV